MLISENNSWSCRRILSVSHQYASSDIWIKFLHAKPGGPVLVIQPAFSSYKGFFKCVMIRILTIFIPFLADISFYGMRRGELNHLEKTWLYFRCLL
jgi:hypothetical protein